MNADGEIARAARILTEGGLVAMPTETVYGLACDASNAEAVARVYAAKGRPRFNPLITHVRGLDEALTHADLPGPARALAERFWPGPLTIVAPRLETSGVAELACAGLSTIALRAPDHEMAQALLAAFGGPIAAPSANRSGGVSPTTAAHAREDLGDAVALTLDGGPCALGLESTIVGFDAAGGARLLRLGAVARADIEALIGLMAEGAGVEAPGMMASHYAPRARLRLNAAEARAGEAFLAFGADAPPGGLTLSARGDVIEAAAKLYAALRALDADGASTIAVAPIPDVGLGEAINDRLARAAAPR